MAISSLGVGSGLDLGGIIQRFMQVEQQPLIAMKRKEATFQGRISALGTLKGALSSLQNAAGALQPSAGQSLADKYQTAKTTIGDSSIASATASSGALPANYTLSNITLAQAHQVRKAASDLTIPAAGNNGTLNIKVGSADGVDVAVNGGMTLGEIAAAINDSEANVNASIINNGSTDFLILSAKDTGASNTITIAGSNADVDSDWRSFSYSTDTTNSWTTQQPASSASVDINGLTITSSSNTIASAIPNVSLTLLKDSTSGTALSVTRDNQSSISSALGNFITAFNSAANSMKSLGAYDPETRSAGALQGDATLRTAQSQVANMLQTMAGGSSAYQSLTDIGIALQADGTLKLDSNKLNAALKADFNGVATVVEKVATAFKTGLDNTVGSTGNINAATDSASQSIKDLQKRQEFLTLRLEQLQARYTKQFSALDSLIAGLNQTGNWLNQQLSSLPGAYSGKS